MTHWNRDQCGQRSEMDCIPPWKMMRGPRILRNLTDALSAILFRTKLQLLIYLMKGNSSNSSRSIQAVHSKIQLWDATENNCTTSITSLQQNWKECYPSSSQIPQKMLWTRGTQHCAEEWNSSIAWFLYSGWSKTSPFLNKPQELPRWILSSHDS